MLRLAATTLLMLLRASMSRLTKWCHVYFYLNMYFYLHIFSFTSVQWLTIFPSSLHESAWKAPLTARKGPLMSPCSSELYIWVHVFRLCLNLSLIILIPWLWMAEETDFMSTDSTASYGQMDSTSVWILLVSMFSSCCSVLCCFSCNGNCRIIMPVTFRSVNLTSAIQFFLCFVFREKPSEKRF